MTMPYKIKVNSYTRRRLVAPHLRELFERLGVKQEVSVAPHERTFTSRRPKNIAEKKVDPEEE